MRARVKRRQRNRRLIIISIFAVLVAVIVLVAYSLSSLGVGARSSLDETGVPASLQQELVKAADSYYGPANSTMMSIIKPTDGTAWTTLPTKPLVVFIGAEYCPYCAAQRWPLTLALMRFGNFTGLEYEQSSSSDVYSATYTFTYVKANYTSNYITFEHYEVEDVNQNTLQTPPTNYTTLWNQYNGEAFPMLIVNNQYEVPSAFFLPSPTNTRGFNGDNWTQIASQLGTGSAIDDEISGATNAITAAICKVDGNRPSVACNNSNVASLTPSLDAFYPAQTPRVSSLVYTGRAELPTLQMQLLLDRRSPEAS